MAFSGGSSTFPDFESHGGRLEAFDDGHIPETFRCAQSTTEEDVPKIVRYNPAAADKNDVHIYNNVLHPHHARMLYEATAPPKQLDSIIKLTGESPWGTYVTVEEALNWINWNETNGKRSITTTAQQTYEDYIATWKETLIEFYMWQQQQQHKPTASSDEKKEEGNDIDLTKMNIEDMDTIRHGLAVEAVAKFFVDTIPSSPGNFVASSPEHSNQTPKKELLYTKRDFLTQAHGVAVWALSSRPGCSVQYHIDYAELLRYEYNVTVPPLWAGTTQCSPLWNGHNKNNMEGGEFCVNLHGLKHYAEHGYKGAISQDSMGGWRSPATSNNTINGGGAPHIDSSNKWITIPYALNRGIVHNGDLPHLSAPVKLINDDHLSRVIVGFNVFGHDVGSIVQTAPEHSKPFRRKVKLYRSALNVSAAQHNDGKSGSKGGVDLSRIRKNKALTKLLVLAKREKVKEQLRHDQNQLTRNIWNMLLQHHGSNENRCLCVDDVVKELGVPSVDSGWPTINDAHVHLHNMLFRHDSEVSTKKYHDVDGIAGIPGAYYTMSVVDDLESSSSTQTNGDGSSRCHLVSTSAAISIIALS